MKLLIFGDNHGEDNLDEIINFEEADIIIHTGDSMMDANEKQLKDVHYKVCGNCDYNDLPPFSEFVVSHYKFALTHGDRYGVKHDLYNLVDSFNDANIIIYGHTHIANMIEINDKLLLNPGSLSMSRSNIAPSYMVLSLKSDVININLKNANSFDTITEMQVKLK